MYEHHKSPLLPRKMFLRRVAISLCWGIGILALALGIGMMGYHFFEHLSWLDSFLNASMILSAMGPVATLQTHAGKIFAGCYALFSGILFISVAGIILAPVVHRALHKFHLEDKNLDKS